MTHASPLRYPGGKAALAGLLIQIRRMNGLGATHFAEPYTGGAGAALSLLYLEETEEIRLNDADPAIHDFWWALIHKPAAFAERLSNAVVELQEWRRQVAIYRSGGQVSRLDRGFAAFYLNRCNRSGIIIDGGPIGGVEQAGKWKLDARFNKQELLQRCRKVGEYADRIKPSGFDGIEFIRDLDTGKTFFFIDPPYFEKGGSLYLNSTDARYHANLAELLESMQDAAWVLTYDDCPEIRRMYDRWANVRPFALRYVASERRAGREVLITPRWMDLPSSQESLAITW
jgi:DNA adenine methylase